jgi:hypothetical protein
MQSSQAQEKVCVGLATYPKREDVITSSLNSLIGQSCKIVVYLNEYKSLPKWTSSPRYSEVDFILGEHTYGNLGDAVKVFAFQDIDAVYFFCVDDDILYPFDYVPRMVHFLKTSENHVALCVHGKRLGDSQFPIQGYFKDQHVDTKLFHFQNALPSFEQVHVPGTGTLMFHKSMHALIPYAELKNGFRNQADIHVAAAFLKARVVTYSVPRPLFWLSDISKYSNSNSIYDSVLNEDVPKVLLNELMEEGFEIP